VIQLVQFTQYNTFSKILPSTSIHFATRVWTWRVARLYSVQCTALSRKPFGMGHMYIYTSFCVEWQILWPPRILIFPPWTLCILCTMQLSCEKMNRETLEGNIGTSVSTWKKDTSTEIDLRGSWST
jgi:hypothetical protein